MALVIIDRAKETTTTTGTGSVTLLGAVTGFQSLAGVGNGNTTFYCIADQSGANWEVGLGTYSTTGPTLARTTVLSSSNSGSLVTFTAGTKDVFVTYPAESAAYGSGTTLVAPSGAILPMANGGAYSGITTNTVTSTTSSFTLTSTSPQVQQFVSDTTTSTATVSVTMPAMNSGMAAGWGRYILQNSTNQQYPIALKDNGGTIRQFITNSGNANTQGLTIKDITTANGTWAVFDSYNITATVNTSSSTSSILTNAGYNIGASAIIPLTATTFAVVWTETQSVVFPAQPNAAIYAQHFSLNTTTNVVTISNKITVQALSNTATMGYNNITFDVDGAGHAFVLVSGSVLDSGCCGNNMGRNGAGWFGLSSSGGTLYASAVTTVGYSSAASVAPGAVWNSSVPLYCAYLGSGNAYAFGFTYTTNVTNPPMSVYFGGATVTGTTAVTLTNSANNIGVSLGTNTNSSVINNYSSRTSLTTFTSGGPATTGGTLVLWGRSISYTPGTNTFTQVARTTATRLAIEQASSALYSSISQGGFMYCPSKVIYGGYSWAITNAGAAGVTTTLNATITAKQWYSPAYGTVTSVAAYRSGFINSTSILAGGLTSDTTASDFNLNGIYNQGYIGAILSTSNYVSYSGWNSTGYVISVGAIAAPFSPV